MLFGDYSSGVTNKKKQKEWQPLPNVVNEAGAANWTVTEIKKWSDTSVNATVINETPYLQWKWRWSESDFVTHAVEYIYIY